MEQTATALLAELLKQTYCIPIRHPSLQATTKHSKWCPDDAKNNTQVSLEIIWGTHPKSVNITKPGFPGLLCSLQWWWHRLLTNTFKCTSLSHLKIWLLSGKYFNVCVIYVYMYMCIYIHIISNIINIPPHNWLNGTLFLSWHCLLISFWIQKSNVASSLIYY